MYLYRGGVKWYCRFSITGQKFHFSFIGFPEIVVTRLRLVTVGTTQVPERQPPQCTAAYNHGFTVLYFCRVYTTSWPNDSPSWLVDSLTYSCWLVSEFFLAFPIDNRKKAQEWTSLLFVTFYNIICAIILCNSPTTCLLTSQAAPIAHVN